jgi:mannonate dehydratase
MKKLEQTWRWFGPNDPITLADIRQTGATGIVTALHHIPNGEPWPVEEIRKRKSMIEAAGLKWSVVESVPVHESIKLRIGTFTRFIENYISTLQNLALSNIRTICYNFMPILDWTRTDLHYKMSDGSEALRFNIQDVMIFDIRILKRSYSEKDYPSEAIQRIAQVNCTISQNVLTKNILAGLPGSETSYTVDLFKEMLLSYKDIDRDTLRANLIEFLQDIIPVAEKLGIRMALHPDDPPMDLFGIPRIVSTEEDYQKIFKAIPSENNGLTFCTGSLGVRPENDLEGMITRFSDRIHFLHLRNIRREKNGSFTESDHLDGDVNMPGVMRSIVALQQKRNEQIPMRPDHGHRMLYDLSINTNPGYSAIGRLRGLAELRGLELGALYFTSPPTIV